MIRTLILILLALPLVTSFAPVPHTPVTYHARIAIHTASIVQTRVSVAQACTWEIAPARLRQQVEDPIGYPYGIVSAWSCSGDTQAVIAELAERASAMQAEAAAYRQAHPITGATP